MDAPQDTVAYIQEHRPKAFELQAFSEDLRNIYFFTEEQIRNVFLKTKTHDIDVFRHVVTDVEQQYPNFPRDISVSDFLYENLMSIENIDPEKRQETLANNIHEILDGDDVQIITYKYFLPSNTLSDKNIGTYIKEHIQHYFQDFFVIHINEDVVIDKNNKKDKARIASKLIQTYIPSSRMQGLNFYVLVQKNGIKKIVVGAQKGSMLASNDWHFDCLAKEYGVTIVNIPLSRFVQR